MNKQKNKGIFYGWWIVVGCVFIMTFIYAPIVNLVSLYTVPVTEDLGIGRTEFMTYYTVMALVSMVVCPIAGKLMRKMDIRIYLTLFSILGATSYIGFSFATNIVHFYIFAVLMGAALAGAAIIPSPVLITNWFNEKRGLCLGIALSGSGLGGVILSPITNWLITDFGWRMSYLMTGIAMLVIIVPFTLFIIRFSPADKGLLPFGEMKSQNSVTNIVDGVTQKEAFKSVSFWALCIAIVVGGIVVNGMIINLGPYLTDIGGTAKQAALLLSLGSAMVIVGKLLVGRLYDQLGIMIMLVFICGSALVSFVFVLHAILTIPGILYSIFTGFGATAVTVTPAFLTSSLFGEKEFSAKFGTVSLFSSLGAAITPIVSGAIYNINHSYILLINVLMILSIVLFALFLLAIKTKPNFNISKSEVY
ncbi:MFS transporter [Lysinibacillus fusiformis]|uniref:MFS transporter n=1 Tax=Lysinibacillus fusiformis TaxID=28031 RepID=UPI00381733A5